MRYVLFLIVVLVGCGASPPPDAGTIARTACAVRNKVCAVCERACALTDAPCDTLAP